MAKSILSYCLFFEEVLLFHRLERPLFSVVDSIIRNKGTIEPVGVQSCRYHTGLQVYDRINQSRIRVKGLVLRSK